MKKILALILAATLSLSAQQPVNVQKTSGTNAITGNLVVGDGKSISATGTGAIDATTFSGLVSGANGGTGVANTGKTITLGGNVTTSGAFNLTLTLSGTTGVTLPTAGTLATLAGSESLTNKKLGSLTSNGLATTSGGDGTLSVTVPGTGVLTALGVNTGTAGAFVVNGGALGTPLSGTVTNLTGTASININGTVGATTPAAGTFTSVTNSGLTATRVPFAGTGGLMTDDSDMTFATDTLTVTKATIGGISHIANAITAANSVTAASATDLTLSGGGSGATITAGQGAVGNVTVAPGTLASGVFSYTGTLDASNSTTAGFKVASGLAVAKQIQTGSTVSATQSTNSSFQAFVGSNGNAGTAANVTFGVNNGTNSLALEMPGGSFTTSGPRVSGRGYIWADGSAGLSLHGINGALRFWTGNAGTERATISTAGVFNLASGTTLTLTDSTASTSTTTGALQVAGGVGIQGKTVTQTLEVVGATLFDADITIASGSQLQSAGVLYLKSAAASNINFRPAGLDKAIMFPSGGFALGSSGSDPGSGVFKVEATTASTSTTTGALVVSGGAGLGGALYVGGNANVQGGTVNVGTTSDNNNRHISFLRPTGSATADILFDGNLSDRNGIFSGTNGSGGSGNALDIKSPNGTGKVRIYTGDGVTLAATFDGSQGLTVGPTTSAGLTATTVGHLASQGTAPTGASGAGAGTSPSAVTVTGHDTAFTVALTTGTSCPSSGVIATITFNTAFTGTAPHPSLSAGGANAAADLTKVYSTTTTTTYVLNARAALTDSTAYTWEVHVIQ